ncbi:protein kinase domain-containing protein [Stutzerimonas tarimensis]|uniref:Protein kinase n=1 Tax=Stutzerimonas tarimensis TaxID=1507735 RepID=A0ABV7T9F2_9GAMM
MSSLVNFKLSIGEASATGPRRENQDAIRVVTPAPALAASKGYLLALADGVSQCADGRLAALSTLQALALDYYSTPETWTVSQSIDRLLVAHNRWLQANGGGQPLLTTLTALILRGRRFTLAHVGDCRAYRWRDGRLQRLTEDHVWTQTGMEHVLKRALGLDQHLVMDFLEDELVLGDCFMLLSDGVWASLAEQELARALRETDDLQEVAERLVTLAHRAGSQDNASAVLVRVESLPEAALADSLAQLHNWPLPARLRAGQTFEGWQVESLRSESRQSLVYRVSDPLGRPWLLKTLPAARRQEAEAGPALLQEEWFLRRVAGRFFPEVHPLPQRQHLYYVQREYPGRTLDEHFRQQGPLPLAQWQQLAPRLIRALGMLHRRNILHRDVKPENLHLDDEGELRLLDFGLAYCPGLSRDALGSVPGTPSFIAPEAFSGAPPSREQDLYAAGVTLYYLLTGHYPHGEIEAFQRPHFGTPVPASRYRPDVPAWLDECLARAVCAEPGKRFETAEEWLLALDQGEQRDSAPQRHRPWFERNPLGAWRTLAIASLLGNLLLLILLSLR